MSEFEKLTNRELEVLKLVAEGLSNKEIGEKLFVSQTTVGSHLTRISTKLDKNNKVQLAVYYVKNCANA